MMWLLVAAALAGEPEEKVLQVPEGSVVTPPSGSGVKPFTVPTYSFLLPESFYDRALVKAKQLDICEPALARAADQTVRWVDVSTKALVACESQFDADQAAVEELRKTLVATEARALAAESRLRDVRTQRTVAWAITGGLILGAVTVTAVAVAN